MLRIWILCILLILHSSARSQEIISNQQVFKVGDGLPQSFITGILQDKSGFIWISTSDGLARYDGRSFKTFSKQKDDPKGLHSSVISLLLPNGPDHFMIVYDGGLVADFNPINFEIKNAAVNIPLQIHGVLLSNLKNEKNKTDNINLFYTNGYGKGINAFDLNTGKIKYYGVLNKTLVNDTIIGITRDAKGTFYLLTPQGLNFSNNGLQDFEFIAHQAPKETLNNYFKDVIQMPDKSFAMISGNKLFLIDPFKNKNTEIKIPGGDAKVRRFERLMGIDNNGKLYFEYNGSIFRLEKNNKLETLWTNNINPNLRITTCFIDKTDVLWVSVDAQGLIKKNLLTAPFHSFNYKNDFFIDIYEKIGISNNKLPQKWLSDKIATYLYYNSYQDSILYLIHSTLKSENDNAFFWQNGILKPLPQLPKKRISLLRGIATNNAGEIWTTDIQNWGLLFWKNKEAVPVFYPFDTTSNNSINGIEIGDVELINNQLWVSTYGKGLFLFEDGVLQKSFSEKYTTSNLPNNLTEIIPDPNNEDLIWVGSRGEGLLLINKKNGLVKIFTTQNGLPNNTIYCIVADKSGLLWLSTNNGICRFNPKDFSSTAFVKADGLAGDEFNRNHKMIFPDGRIAFGGLDGYSIFNPDDFNEKRISAYNPIQITKLIINNIEKDFISNLNLFNNEGNTLSLKLPYYKNNLSIEFAALQFNEPQKIRYRYMLKGMGEEWIKSGFNNVANFAQMRPGNYNLIINATSINGEWSNSNLELNIIISPPFWATWWAYVAYLLVFAFLLRSYILYNKSKIKKQHEAILIKNEAERLKEMDEMKDKFFSNITHEFRTPLTLILSPLEKLKGDNSLSQSANSTVQTIYRNTKRLLVLINEFLDFSKLQVGIIKVVTNTGNLVLFVSEVVEEFVDDAVDKNIKLIFNSDEESGGVYLFDKDKWQKIISNLLSNALKFTSRGGTIKVHLSRVDNIFKLEISDTGKGISDIDKKKIFERFFQVDNNSIVNSYGTGIGLSFVKELTLLMNGKVEVVSEVNKGSIFIVSIPVEKANSLQEISSLQNQNKILENNFAKRDNLIHEKHNILIAEDDQELRSFLFNSLSDEFNIIVSANGVEAWEKIISEMPDVIISDVMMPLRDGFELCKLCKEDLRTSHICFILLTTRAAHELKMKGLEVGADEYITKPFHLDELRLRINNMLKLQQKQKEFLQSQVIKKHPEGKILKVENDFLTEFYKVIEENIDDPQLGVDFIANAFSMSRSSLNRKLKSIVNISSNDLIRNYRLQKASALLMEGNDITSTSYKVGFSSPSYFAKCFKEEFEITPSQFVSTL